MYKCGIVKIPKTLKRQLYFLNHISQQKPKSHTEYEHQSDPEKPISEITENTPYFVWFSVFFPKSLALRLRELELSLWCLSTRAQLKVFTYSIPRIWASRASILCHRRQLLRRLRPARRRFVRRPITPRRWRRIRARRSGNRIRLPSPGRAGRTRSTTSFQKLSSCKLSSFNCLLVYCCLLISVWEIQRHLLDF